MAEFPDDFYSGRDVADRDGVVYDADKTKVFFAKDHNDPVAEIEAIQAWLGTKGRHIFSNRDELTAPNNADYFGVQDNSDGKILKYLTFTGLKSFLKTYFDTLYSTAVKATGAEITTGTDDAKFATPKAIADAVLPTAIFGAGAVLQMVYGTTSSQVTNNTSTYADTGLTATITPKFSTSKILVLINHAGCWKSSDHSDNRISIALFRDSTEIEKQGSMLADSTAKTQRLNQSFIAVDSPASTSALVYKTKFKNEQNTASVVVQKDGNSGNSYIVLLEIKQ